MKSPVSEGYYFWGGSGDYSFTIWKKDNRYYKWDGHGDLIEIEEDEFHNWKEKEV